MCDAEPKTQLASGRNRPGERLLLVDDSELFRERLARAFRERGYEVATAQNYDEAMQLVPQYRPDFAVVDLRMPGESGLTLVRDLKQFDESLRVLVLSGFGSIATAIDAVRLGATNFLPKPADADDILAAFERGEDQTASQASPPETPSLARAEWEHIHRVLADCNGNVSEAGADWGFTGVPCKESSVNEPLIRAKVANHVTGFTFN